MRTRGLTILYNLPSRSPAAARRPRDGPERGEPGGATTSSQPLRTPALRGPQRGPDLLRAPWLRRGLRPALLGLAAAVLGVVLWQALLEERRGRIREAAAAVADAAAVGLETRVEDRITALRGLSVPLGPQGSESAAAWQHGAEMLVAGGPGLRAVAWLPHGEGAGEPRLVRGAAVRGWSARALLAAAREAAAAGSAGALFGPLRPDPEDAAEDSGEALGAGAAWGVALPVHDDAGARAGTLVGMAAFAETFPFSELLERSGYALSLRWDGHDILRSGEPAAGDLAWWIQRRTVELSGGARWTLALAPTERLVASHAPSLPAFVLAGAILVALLIAAVTYEVQVARERGQELERANRSLEEEVAERLRADAEIRRLNRDLESRVAARTAALDEAIADLEAFNYSVSHDLKSPIGAILNFATVLEEDCGDALDESGRHYLARIAATAENALGMMEGLLAFARLGQERIERSGIDLAKLARGVFEELAGESDVSRIRFRVDEMPPAFADPSMMRIVLRNLIGNAMKFTRGEESPEIRVGGRREDEENVYFVEDNGVGFDMRFARKLFGVFERLHARDAYGGYGVGLAIVARILRHHGGRVWARAALGEGATFFFALPRPLPNRPEGGDLP